jgi:Leucine-rich repeat (LRR) protein
LKELHFSRNSIYRVPSDISKLSNLIKLRLAVNELRRLPPEISNLSKLEELEITRNKIGIIPLDLWGIDTNCKIKLTTYQIEVPLDLRLLKVDAKEIRKLLCRIKKVNLFDEIIE